MMSRFTPHGTARRVRYGVAIAAVLGALGACSGARDLSAPTAPVTVGSVSVSPSDVTVPIGATVTLQAAIHDPSGAAVPNASVFWSSSDTTIAIVSSAGVVVGRTTGTVQIAASAGGRSGVAAVTIVPKPVASVAVTPATTQLVVGTSATLRAVTYDANGGTLTGRTVVWASSAPGTVSVDAGGTVRALAAGTATITATSEGKAGSATVTATVVPVATVSVTPASATLAVGATTALAATTQDASGNVLAGRAIAWTSSNSGVATVSAAGLVTAVAAGTATITATSEGRSGTAQIVVSAPAPSPSPSGSVASVVVSPAGAMMGPRSSLTLTAHLFDARGREMHGVQVKWSTSDDHVVTVQASDEDSATATVQSGKRAGSATITATAGGASGTAAIVVW